MKKYFFSFILIATSFILVNFINIAKAEETIGAEEINKQTLGRTEGIGFNFEVNNSEYLNIKLDSSESIKLTLESMPEMITMNIESSTFTTATSAQITLLGFNPDTKYYKYEDDYHNLTEFITDETGSYSYIQDVSQQHIIFIQPKKSTKFIKDNATGGDCYLIGNWDASTKTCVLKVDLNETVQIDSNYITLDGNGRTITGSNTGVGIYLYRKTGVIIKNLNIKKFGIGIYLSYSSNNNINNNIATLNNKGINFLYSNGNNINNNITNYNYSGIFIDTSRNNILIDSVAKENDYYDVYVYASSSLDCNNTINNIIGSGDKPIKYYNATAILDNETLSELVLCNADNSNISNITIDGSAIKKNNGLLLAWTDNSSFSNINSSNNYEGVYFWRSSGNNFSNNIFNLNSYSGMYSTFSINNVLMNNTANLNNHSGIWLSSSGNSTLINNTVSNNYHNGIFFSRSSSNNNNILTSNIASNNRYGIFFDSSNGNTLTNNTMSNNLYNFYLLGPDTLDDSYSNNVIDTSNKVDGKSIYYVKNAMNTIYDSSINAGTFYCILCNNVTIKDLILANNGYGIFFWRTTNSKIQNVTTTSNSNEISLYASNNNIITNSNSEKVRLYFSHDNTIADNIMSGGDGIILGLSNNNTLANNIISNGHTGVMIASSNNNTFTNNNVSNNKFGIELSSSGNNILMNNVVANNYYGIYSSSSNTNNNQVYNNNFIHNQKQSYIISGSGNIFNLDKPTGGNYWSDFDESIEGCNDLNNDNFCDFPYIFLGGQDNMPWKLKDSWIIDSIIPDTNIISVIDGNGNNISNNNPTFSDSTTFSFSGTDNVGVASFQCSSDNVVFTDCASPKTYTNLSIGNHIFKVRAKDATGNVDDTPATFSWTVKPLPVVLLPGILGSWTDNLFEPFTNPNSIDQSKLLLTEESQAWFWRQLDSLGYLPHTWQDLRTKLPELGYPVYKCPFDWRNDNEYSAQNYLMPCIDKAKQETGSNKVNVVAHSMGGLTTRAYIQNDSLYRKDINKFAMVGTPNHGSPNIYYSWEGGSLSALISTNISSWSGILGAIFENAVGDRLTQMATHFLRTGKTTYIHLFFPSLQELLPTFDYLENQFGSVRNVLSMVWQNNFLNDLNSRSNIFKLNSQVNTKIFAGEGHPTLETIKILYPNPDNLFSNPNDPYPDGLPIPLLEEKNNLGDGTVLSQKSAKITETLAPFEVKNKTSDNPENFLQHTNLPNSFLGEIISFIGGQSSSTSSYSPILPKEILAISLASPAELLIVDPQGRKLGFDYRLQSEKYEIPKGIYSGKDELELAVIIDPQPGEYKVFIIGNGDGEFNTGISYAKESCDNIVSQDNFGQTTAGVITTFTVNLQGDCQKDSVKYSLDSIIDIDPDVLNIDSKGNYITAYIELPVLYKVEDIDVSTIKLNNQISAIWFLKTLGDYDNDGITDLMVKFKRNEVQGIVSAGENQLTISGNLRDGTRFEGEDMIKVMNNR